MYGSFRKVEDKIVTITQVIKGGYAAPKIRVISDYVYDNPNGYRTGTNRNVAQRAEYPQSRRQPKLVKQQVSKLSTRILVYSEKKKKYVWVPQSGYVYRIGKTKPKKKTKSLKGSKTILPNAFEASFVTTKKFGPNAVSVTNIAPASDIYVGQTMGFTYTGDLTCWFPDWSNLGVGPSGVETSEAPSAYLTSTIPDLENRTLSMLYKRVKNQSVNFAQVLAESSMTRKMVLDVVRRLATTLIQLKRGNIRLASLSLFPSDSKTLANDTLMIQYGIRPLLQDLDGMMETLAVPEKIVVDVVVSQTRTLPPQVIFVNDTRNSRYLGVRNEIISEGTVTVKRKVTLTCTKEALRMASRLGFGNPASLAWELIPFSFIADWFIRIGDWLNSQDAFSGLVASNHTKTVFIRERRTLLRSFGGTYQGFLTQPVVVGRHVEMAYTKRTLVSDVPSMPLPTFKNPISIEHLINFAALVTQLKR